MAADLTKITEPPADPTENRPAPRRKKTAAAPIAGLPLMAPEPVKAPKVSPRTDYAVTAVVGGYDYGPFVVEAVDESEAIQRVLDTHQELKAQASSSGSRFRAAKKTT